MADLAFYLAGLLAVLVGLGKLLPARGRPRSPGRAYLCGALVCLGLAGVALAPGTLRAAAPVEPIPNLTRLIGNAVTVAGVFSTTGLLEVAALPAEQASRRMRRQAGVLVAVLIAMAALFLSARTQFTVDFLNVYATHPVVAAYEVVFLSYVTWGLIGIARMLYQIAGHAPRTFLRAGLQVLAAAAVVGLAWSLWKIVIMLLKVVTRMPVPVEDAVSSFLAATAILLMALGATMAVWGPWVAHPVRWLCARRIHRQIESLWTALNAAVPDVEFDQPGAGIEFRLYHRIVEIRDSSLALRVYFHPDVTAWVRDAGRASGIDDDTELAVLAEAANLAAALEAHRARHRYHADPSTAALPRELDPDIEAESRWLIRVAAAFSRSPVVEDVRHRVRAELDGDRVSDPE